VSNHWCDNGWYDSRIYVGDDNTNKKTFSEIYTSSSPFYVEGITRLIIDTLEWFSIEIQSEKLPEFPDDTQWVR